MIKHYDIPVNPNTKPRMTKRDKWKHRPCVDQYYGFKDQIKLHANLLGLQTLPDSIESLIFVIQMPESWSEVKKMKHDRMPHKQKPDCDNFLKALMDSLCKEDKSIWHFGLLEKRWGRTGKILLTLDDT